MRKGRGGNPSPASARAPPSLKDTTAARTQRAQHSGCSKLYLRPGPSHKEVEKKTQTHFPLNYQRVHTFTPYHPEHSSKKYIARHSIAPEASAPQNSPTPSELWRRPPLKPPPPEPPPLRCPTHAGTKKTTTTTTTTSPTSATDDGCRCRCHRRYRRCLTGRRLGEAGQALGRGGSRPPKNQALPRKRSSRSSRRGVLRPACWPGRLRPRRRVSAPAVRASTVPVPAENGAAGGAASIGPTSRAVSSSPGGNHRCRRPPSCAPGEQRSGTITRCGWWEVKRNRKGGHKKKLRVFRGRWQEVRSRRRAETQKTKDNGVKTERGKYVLPSQAKRPTNRPTNPTTRTPKSSSPAANNDTKEKTTNTANKISRKLTAIHARVRGQGAHPTLGIAPALGNKAATAAVREAAHGGADEVGHGLEEPLVLPRVAKNGEKVLLRGERKYENTTAAVCVVGWLWGTHGPLASGPAAHEATKGGDRDGCEEWWGYRRGAREGLLLAQGPS